MVANALTNEAAMETLHGGFAGEPTRWFLPQKQGKRARSFRTPVLPGMQVHVLGPSHDEAVIRDMDPRAGEAYLRLADAVGRDGRRPAPFHPSWRAPRGGWPRHSLSEAALREIEELSVLDEGTEGMVAASLDKSVNGTSLMLVLQIGRATLLLPGDAQWGTWKAALADPEWVELLAKTTFYKVGHHGSHNATHPGFVDGLHGHDKLAAMVSTRPMSKWPDIPRAPLLKALRERTSKLVRSDRGALPAGFSSVKGRYWIDVTLKA